VNEVKKSYKRKRVEVKVVKKVSKEGKSRRKRKRK
jgi:hypothetical protein